MKNCPECGNVELNWDKEKGEIICRVCGLVIDDKLVDFGQEWREFDENSAKLRRTGAPLRFTEYDLGLSTTVGSKQDIQLLHGKDKWKFKRLRQWQNRVATSIERNLKFAMAELKRISSVVGLAAQVEEEAARLYTLAVHKNIIRGRTMEAVIASCLYAASRRFELPRSLEDFALAIGMEKKDVGRTYRFVVRELELKIFPSDPSDYLPKLISTLGLDAKTQSLAADLVQRSKELGLTSGKTPNGMAAAAVYVAAVINGVRKTQRSVADAAGITEVTIRNRYKDMERTMDIKRLMHETKKREKQETKMRALKKMRQKRKEQKKKTKDLKRKI